MGCYSALTRTQTYLAFIICSYSTKKKKMADKILPQRVSINQTVGNENPLILDLIVLVRLHLLVHCYSGGFK